MKGHVPDEVSLVPEGPSTLWALVCLLLWLRRNVVGIVVEVLVPLEQLALPERLVALVALEGFLVSVNQHVGLQVALGNGAVRTQIALEAPLTLVGLLVNLCNQSMPKAMR